MAAMQENQTAGHEHEGDVDDFIFCTESIWFTSDR